MKQNVQILVIQLLSNKAKSWAPCIAFEDAQTGIKHASSHPRSLT